MATYSKAPIIEAAIDIHFDEQLKSRDLDRLRDRLKSRYPAIQQRQLVEVQLYPTGPKAVPKSAGFRLDAADGSSLVLINPSSFTSVKLAPYDDWPHLIDMAKQNFVVFEKIVKSPRIIRLGTRFINRFDILNSEYRIDSDDLLHIYKSPNNLHGIDINNYWSQIDGLDNETGFTTKVATGTAPPALIDHTSCLLDIDVISLTPSPYVKDIWGEFDRMRDLKNRIFESSISEKMRAALQ